MTAILTQNSAGSVSVLFELSSDGSPALGLVDTDVTADLKKEGGSFTAFTLTPANFTDEGGGVYEIDLAVADTDTLGNLYLRLIGPTVRSTLVVAFVTAVAAPPPPTTAPDLPTTPIFGFVKGIDGTDLAGATVSARILSAPTILQSGSEGVLVASQLITAKTDAQGFFSLDLITGSVVDIFIPGASYRRTLTVPASSSNLFEIP
jgi:hypothetical protein